MMLSPRSSQGIEGAFSPAALHSGTLLWNGVRPDQRRLEIAGRLSGGGVSTLKLSRTLPCIGRWLHQRLIVNMDCIFRLRFVYQQQK